LFSYIYYILGLGKKWETHKKPCDKFPRYLGIQNN
jgi:hypothetical protein